VSDLWSVGLEMRLELASLNEFILVAEVLAKNEASFLDGCPMFPDFLHGAPPTDARAAFI
jgi:hypothetical protein